ncbi:large terminase protein [Caudoviricetes sp.]|nr:large terminase protein [Caudoviricetes sp.]
MGKVAKPISIQDIQAQMKEALQRTAVRPSIAGYKPQDYQIPFHESTKQGRLIIGGNRSGKTVAGAAEAVMRLTGKHPVYNRKLSNVRGRAIAVDFPQGIEKVVLPEIARWIPPSSLKNGSWEESYVRGTRTLTLENDSFLEFMSYDQDVDKFSGTSRDFVWFDEEPPEDIFNENMMRLIDVGGDWWMTMTPLFDMSWTQDRIYDAAINGTNPNIEAFVVNTLQNKYISEVEFQALTAGLSEDQKAARQHGTYMSGGGLIYKDFIKGTTFVPSILHSDEWPLYYEHGQHFGMLDHGFRGATAFLLGVIMPKTNQIFIYDEYYYTKRLVGENARAILALIEQHKLTDKLQWVVCDPAMDQTDPITGTSTRMEYGKEGLYLSPGNNSVHVGIQRVATRLSQNLLFICDNCTMTKWEMNRYRWDKYTNSKTAARHNLKETPIKKDDHAMDALRYGICTTPSFPDEVNLRIGNVLNAPLSINSENYTDTITSYSDAVEEMANSYLGSEY